MATSATSRIAQRCYAIDAILFTKMDLDSSLNSRDYFRSVDLDYCSLDITLAHCVGLEHVDDHD